MKTIFFVIVKTRLHDTLEILPIGSVGFTQITGNHGRMIVVKR